MNQETIDLLNKFNWTWTKQNQIQDLLRIMIDNQDGDLGPDSLQKILEIGLGYNGPCS